MAAYNKARPKMDPMTSFQIGNQLLDYNIKQVNATKDQQAVQSTQFSQAEKLLDQYENDEKIADPSTKPQLWSKFVSDATQLAPGAAKILPPTPPADDNLLKSVRSQLEAHQTSADFLASSRAKDFAGQLDPSSPKYNPTLNFLLTQSKDQTLPLPVRQKAQDLVNAIISNKADEAGAIKGAEVAPTVATENALIPTRAATAAANEA